MGTNSKIEWCDHTFNPWLGCQRVCPGCDHCYAERWGKRFGVVWGHEAVRVRTEPRNWMKPRSWNDRAEKLGIRYRVFCASLADVFDNRVPEKWREDLWELISTTPHLDWILVTKRIGNAAKMLPSNWGRGWSHVWLLATVVNQDEAERDIPKLLRTPARVRGLSIEPMLGPINLRHLDVYHADREWCQIDALTGRHSDMGRPCPDVPQLDWVIVGGESGPGFRPMDPDWVRSIRGQCKTAGIPFFFKQWGGVGGGLHRRLDGDEWSQYPRGAA